MHGVQRVDHLRRIVRAQDSVPIGVLYRHFVGQPSGINRHLNDPLVDRHPHLLGHRLLRVSELPQRGQLLSRRTGEIGVLSVAEHILR